MLVLTQIFTRIIICYTQTLLHTASFYIQGKRGGTGEQGNTQTLLHTEAVTHTHELLHTAAVTHRSYHTNNILHVPPVCMMMLMTKMIMIT